MSAIMLNYEASNKLMTMHLNMQRQYIKARRNVKERLAAKGNKDPQKQRVYEYRNALDFLKTTFSVEIAKICY